jgi:hypothetical protein
MARQSTVHDKVEHVPCENKFEATIANTCLPLPCTITHSTEVQIASRSTPVIAVVEVKLVD